MILKSFKLFSQNVWKNKTFMNTILESYIDFNILFIQEPLWSFIYSIPSFSNKEGDSLVGAPNHSNWITFFRPMNNNNNHPMSFYTSIHISLTCAFLYKKIYLIIKILIAFPFSIMVTSSLCSMYIQITTKLL